MEIYLIRHGEMAGDPHEFYQPPVSGCLSELGLKHAEAVAEALNGDTRFDAVYSSPLGRAVQTAQPLARKQALEIQIVPWMREWIPASQLALKASDAQYKEAMAAAGEIRLEQAWKTPAGEGTFEMAHRIIPPFLELLGTHGVHAAHGGYLLDDEDNSTRIAIFAHGGSLSVLLGFLLGIPLQPYGSVGFKYTGVAALKLIRRVDVWYPVLDIRPPYNGLPV